MKKTFCFYLALMVPLSAENLFDNSKMDTAGGWKGTKKFVKEESPAAEDQNTNEAEVKENRVLVVSAKKRDWVEFSQEVASKGIKDLVLKFRYRTNDYAGRGLELRGYRQDRSSTFKNYTLVADGQWHEIEWKFTQVGNSNKIDFSFFILEGEGDVSFDDITVEPR